LQAAGGKTLEQQHVALHLLGIGDEFACPREHQLARGGEANLAVGTVDEARIQVLFQVFDAARQGRLREVDGLGSPPEAALLGQCDQVAKLAELNFALQLKTDAIFCIGY
jgi:hypothetical protein